MALAKLNNTVKMFDFDHKSPEEIHNGLKTVYSFVEDNILGTPEENSIPSLDVVIFAVRAAIYPSLILVDDAIPHLLDLVTNLEEYRLEMVKSMDENITFDDYYKKVNDIEACLPVEKRKRLDDYFAHAPRLRQSYICVISGLCSAHIHYLLSADEFDLLQFMAFMNSYFPWFASDVSQSPLLHFVTDALSPEEAEAVKKIGAQCRDAFFHLVKWAKDRQQANMPLKEAFRGPKPNNIISDIGGGQYNSILTELLREYVNDITNLHREISDFMLVAA